MHPHEQVRHQNRWRDVSLYDILSQRREDMEAEREELTDEDPLSEAEPLAGGLGLGTWDRVHKPTVCGQMAP